MNVSKRVGSPQVLLAEKWGKSMISATFTVPPSDKTVEYRLFHSRSVCQTVIGITKEGYILTVKQLRYGIAVFFSEHGKTPLIRELPAGGPDGDEEWKDAARRELREETGYTSRSMVRLTDRIWHDPACSTLSSVPWLAFNCRKVGEVHLDDGEVLDVELIPVATWFKMIFSGRICDCRTIATSMLAIPHLRKKGFEI